MKIIFPGMHIFPRMCLLIGMGHDALPEDQLTDLALAGLSLVFPDIRRGNTYGEGSEADLEDAPLRIGVEQFESYPAFMSLVLKEIARGHADKDPRPVAMVTAKRGQDPVVVMSLRDFVAFAEQRFFRGDQ